MNREEYDLIDAEHYSRIKNILKSPAKYLHELDKPEKPDPIRFAVGRLVHAMVLENKDLRDMFAIKPKGMKFSSTEGAAWRDAQALPILEEGKSDSVPLMAEAILKNKEARYLLERCMHREIVIQAKINGLDFKGALDGVGMDENDCLMFPDIKTTGDARIFKFKKTIDEQHYDLQDEIYTKLLATRYALDYQPKSAWIAVEVTPPHEVCCYFPSQSLVEIGQLKLQAATNLLWKCRKLNQWPKLLGGFHEVEPSTYALENATKLLNFSL